MTYLALLLGQLAAQLALQLAALLLEPGHASICRAAERMRLALQQLEGPVVQVLPLAQEGHLPQRLGQHVLLSVELEPCLAAASPQKVRKPTSSRTFRSVLPPSRLSSCCSKIRVSFIAAVYPLAASTLAATKL